MPLERRKKALEIPSSRERLVRENLRELKKLESREYKIYKEEEKLATLPRTLYEKACRISYRIIKVTPDKKTGKMLKDAIEFSHLRVTPSQVASFTIVFAMLVCFPTLILTATRIFLASPDPVTGDIVPGFGLDAGYSMLIFVLAIPFTYYIYVYPVHTKKKYEMDAGSEIVTMIMYMAMYMRNTPNLEGALRFASENISGPLGFELRKLLWDVEIGNYLTVNEALLAYTKKWSRNREFIEAVEIIITSLNQSGERRVTMLNEAINIILRGNMENAKHFNQSLRTPVTVVHAMGIVLPVLGLVLFPIVAFFLNVDIMALFIGYDILLPVFLFFIIKNILEKRPATFSKIDISDNPNIPKEGRFRFRKRDIKAWPIGILSSIAVFSIAFLIYMAEGQNGVLSPVLFVFSVAIGLSTYFILVSSPFLKVRSTTRDIESEFAEALFQMGEQISSGVPIELSMEHSVRRIGNLKIKEFFQKALNNISQLGLTFEQAFFDKKYGAVNLYPSRLIKSVMRAVSESSRRGVKTASMAMLTISRYLKGIHRTQEDVKDELSETLSSLRFQAFFLSPMISGVVVTLGIVILTILEGLGASTAGFSFMELPLLLNEINVTSFQFVFVVAVYLFETCLILSLFINGIDNGEDPIELKSLAGYSLVIGFVVFMTTLFITFMIFMPLLTPLLGLV